MRASTVVAILCLAAEVALSVALPLPASKFEHDTFQSTIRFPDLQNNPIMVSTGAAQYRVLAFQINPPGHPPGPSQPPPRTDSPYGFVDYSRLHSESPPAGLTPQPHTTPFLHQQHQPAALPHPPPAAPHPPPASPHPPPASPHPPPASPHPPPASPHPPPSTPPQPQPPPNELKLINPALFPQPGSESRPKSHPPLSYINPAWLHDKPPWYHPQAHQSRFVPETTARVQVTPRITLARPPFQ